MEKKLRKEDLDKEYYQQIADDFEKEENKEECNLPEEWEKDFKRIISHNLDKNDRKRKMNRLSVAAAILLVAGAGSNMWAYQVSGTNVYELFSASFSKGNYEHNVIGTDPDIALSVTNEDEETDIFFMGDTLAEVLANIRKTNKRPMFYITDVFGDYRINEASYNTIFRTTTIEIESSDGISYIMEDDLFENTGVGIESDNEIVSTIRNKNLDLDIKIYSSSVDNGQQRYIFYVLIGNSQLCFDGAISLKNCEKLAKNLYYE